MLGNYLTSTIRALQRDKFHALLNIAGLTLSLAVTFLMVLYIRYEFSYEDFFTEPDRVFVVETYFEVPGQLSITGTGVPIPAFEAMAADFGDQVTLTFLSETYEVIAVGDRLQREVIDIVDPHFFEVLDFPLAYGNYEDLFNQPDKLILTESIAENLFGKGNAVGEYMQVDGQDFQVAAILKDIPTNTVAAEVKVLVSTASPLFDPMGSWQNVSGSVFLRATDARDVQAVEAQLSSLVDRYRPDYLKDRFVLSFSLVRFDRLHLLNDGLGILSKDHNLVVASMVAAMSLLLVLIASFNYINLSTARALLRTKEVGIRKILGARKSQLAAQFLGEAMLTIVLSCVLAFGLAAIFLPVFSVLVDRQLLFADLISPQYLLIIGGVSLCIGLLSGLYPALFLASARPRDLFGNQKSSTGKRSWLRSAIVSAQFSMTLCLIIVASIIFAQSNYLQTLDFGFRKQGVLVISNLPGHELRQPYNQALLDSPYIETVGSSVLAPGKDYEWYTNLHHSQGDTQGLSLLNLPVDDTFFDVYDISPVVGRVFSESLGDTPPSESSEGGTRRVILSESAVTSLGFSSAADAVGKLLLDLSDETNAILREYEIIGVVPDIQFRLTEAPVVPTAFFYRSHTLETTSALVAPDSVEAALAHAEQTWKAMFPDKPFEYEFLEDRIEAANADEQRQAQLFIYLTGLAIFVTCLGLFGLVSFVAARRTREVAIRKVLGATVGDLSRLLIWEFAKPILVANLMAWPVAWILMRHWLDGFDSRIELSLWFFVGASLLALIIALATVLSRIWKTTQTHPAIALKYE